MGIETENRADRAATAPGYNSGCRLAENRRTQARTVSPRSSSMRSNWLCWRCSRNGRPCLRSVRPPGISAMRAIQFHRNGGRSTSVTSALIIDGGEGFGPGTVWIPGLIGDRVGDTAPDTPSGCGVGHEGSMHQRCTFLPGGRVLPASQSRPYRVSRDDQGNGISQGGEWSVKPSGHQRQTFSTKLVPRRSCQNSEAAQSGRMSRPANGTGVGSGFEDHVEASSGAQDVKEQNRLRRRRPR